jgi:dUTP pyrophosphatase
MRPTIKVKKTHPQAVLPIANNKDLGTGDTGYDLTAVERCRIGPGISQVVEVGLTLAYITPGYWFRIEPRSGLGFKSSIQPHLGVIDNGYRGDLGVKLYNFNDKYFQVRPGDRIAQLVVYPLIQPTFEFTDDIDDTARGDKGFGSSDSEYFDPEHGSDVSGCGHDHV